MNVVVFGASGTIGRPLLAELAREHDVVAVSRTQRPDAGDVTWKTADATDRRSVARVVEGADVVYYLVHSLGSADFEEQDLKAAETTAREAERAGVGEHVAGEVVIAVPLQRVRFEPRTRELADRAEDGVPLVGGKRRGESHAHRVTSS